MAYTTHGHHIEGTPRSDRNIRPVARCGGPRICTLCSREASIHRPPKRPRVDTQVVFYFFYSESLQKAMPFAPPLQTEESAVELAEDDPLGIYFAMAFTPNVDI